ncbi:30S ribosomal protein S11 [Candidatus Endomicrobiellum agilis]|jgi:small subunit ribosomal protein S11|uniref:30S ribosomal protein S11 n=1 Tax=Candidatus Endomicrobiellum agilis TaxID=3238957 RepID=UPI003572652C|nr:30S ribosomal protein S11 [Endomicrobium sp.]MCA6085724.1 30S ribosomal protein S11 [Endomicrobium sp.]
MAEEKRSAGSKKKRYTGGVAKAYILSTFNNTIVNVTDEKGNTLVWSSSGGSGFKGTKKGTPFAAQMTAVSVGKKALSIGVKQIAVFVKGPGPGRETAIRGLQSSGLSITAIKDITPVPHDGCRPPKLRRV